MSVHETVRPPIPDPARDPRSADEMADEGDREGPVLEDGSRSEEIGIERSPGFARKGE